MFIIFENQIGSGSNHDSPEIVLLKLQEKGGLFSSNRNFFQE